MNKTNPYAKPDPLRGRFTRFMEILVKRARINYLGKLSRYPETISFDDLPESVFASDDQIMLSSPVSTFDFEEESLAEAFAALPLSRQKILIFLFVEDMSPEEIAVRINCTVGHVYNQRSLALKKLRQLLAEGGEKK